MDKAKIKTIVILLLAVINLALAVNLIYSRYTESVIPQQTIDNTLAFLERCGIWIEDSAIPYRTQTVRVQTLARDPKAEAAIAAAFLGETVKSEQGGGIDVYTGVAGEAVFRRGGLVNIVLQNQPQPASADEAGAAAKALLERADILPSDYGMVVETGTAVTVRFVCEINGLRLRNVDLSVSYADGTATIVGCVFVGEPERGEAVSRQLTAILADFGAYAAEYELDVSLIVAAEAAYYHTVEDDGGIRLIPAVYIKTDGGDYVMSGLDGSILSGS
ncbi:MAG: hypothetical protein IKC99_03815 [Clostridia bacterium]|nr:hypothetical protein [Oscillospiraceae bacterium]MBQ4048627.1 hypothetical protein [Clostridia bacterium]MBR7137166.1 hypothetical protein [Clostridia bacterium]